MPKMDDLTRSESPFLKHHDLEEMLGQRWEDINVNVTVEFSSMDTYPDGKPAYLLKLAGIAKPLGMNKTNLRKLAAFYPAVEDFPSSQFQGIRLRLFVTETEMGPGIRIAPVRDTVQEASTDARERIEKAAARVGEHVPPGPDHGDPAEPAGRFDDGDPGPSQNYPE